MQAIIPNQNTNQDDWTLKETILYSALGLATLGGSAYLIRKMVLNGIANREEKRSFEDGSSATHAKQIKMAFENDGWPGTDTDALRNTLRQISSKDEFSKVLKSYNKLYQSNLIKEMSDELQTSEYNEMIHIINAKPNKEGEALSSGAYISWAKRLKAAFDKSYGFMPGTDEEAISAVFNEIPTQNAFLQVASAYQKEYGTTITDDLKSELEFWEYSDYMKIITSKPQG